ncbi:MAG: hypothetical protein EAZ65_05680 [Verrucomicrobia bacterium]|nr:MAG: hypothetical protein EAZ84_01225 [Verrucomicrobiota bacterium]TAE87831.1 MAG: hypothetical protein EAZ82_06345 [Verrucomicrobiota bacterium]TAF25574.1 MAG: hypothetical protein EAZ71_07270 [Verrucomicrobiota bacterium]TAF41359.1 MAG: hypothetical protein EAZ65_05680 [Verrucomicrobiota bacterium]
MAYKHLSESKAAKIARMIADLSFCADLSELESLFVQQALTVLPGECLAWNNWAPSWESLISGRLNGGYHEEFHRHLDAFSETVSHHPVVRANQFAASSTAVLKLTHYQSSARFRENPLYREVYRHIDSRFQIAFAPSCLSDRRILLTLNRKQADFEEEDEESLDFGGRCLDRIARAIDEKQTLERAWLRLCSIVGEQTGIGPIQSLGESELRLLTDLLQKKNISQISVARKIRRDTVDKRMASIRERLGLENNRQLLSALAELQTSGPLPHE